MAKLLDVCSNAGSQKVPGSPQMLQQFESDKEAGSLRELGQSITVTQKAVSTQPGSVSTTRKSFSKRKPRRPGLSCTKLTTHSYRRAHSDLNPGGSSATRTRSNEEMLAAVRSLARRKKPSVHSERISTIETSKEDDVTISCESQLQQRTETIKELLQTERQYVDNLTLVHTLFLQPLVESLRDASPILSSSRMSEIFSNFIDIVYTNSVLLAMLQERLDPNQTSLSSAWSPSSDAIGDVFIKFGHFFKMYNTYCRNFTSASIAYTAELESNVRFRRSMRDEGRVKMLHGLSFESFLLLPVQRVPRYRLLLQQVLRRTPPSHNDYDDVLKALVIVDEVAIGINQAIKQYECWLELYHLQKRFINLDRPLTAKASNFLIKRGSVYKFCNGLFHKRELLLLNDCLILATPVVFSGLLKESQECYVFQKRVSLTHLTLDILNDRSSATSSTGEFCWRITCPADSFILSCPSKVVRYEWIECIERAKLEQSISLSSLRQGSLTESSLKTSGRRRFPLTTLQFSAFWPFTLLMDCPILKGHPAPIWIADSAMDACQLCFKFFGLFRGRHHCRICGQLVCAGCSSKRFRTRIGGNMLRACTKCYFSKFCQDSAAEAGAKKLAMSAAGNLNTAERLKEIQNRRRLQLLHRVSWKASIRLSSSEDIVQGWIAQAHVNDPMTALYHMVLNHKLS